MLQRQVAYKIQAGDILYGKTIFDGDRFSALDYNGVKISRVNILGNIIDKYLNEEKKFCSLTLDDGSGQIRLKGFSDQFELINNTNIGDTVMIIGLLRHYNEELYVMPEIIKKVDSLWLNIRKLELGIKKENIPETTAGQPLPPPQNNVNITPQKEKPKQEPPKELQVTQEKIGSDNVEKITSPKLKVLELIRNKKEMDIEEIGVSMTITPEELNSIISDLITEGEIYELKPGHLCSVN